MRRVSVFAYDWGLILCVLLLNAVGLVALYSAAPVASMFTAQIVWTALGMGTAMAMQLASRRQLLNIAFPLYGIALVTLLAVLIVGDEVNGAKAWIKLGPVGFQPSEIAKIATVLTLAKLLSNKTIEKISDYIPVGILVVPIMGLVFVEPDLGGTLVIVAATTAMLFVREMPWKHIIVVAITVGIALPTVLWPKLSGYQRERIEILFDLNKDAGGKGYQQIQSIIAIGSGGLTGKGFMQGKQTQLGFVPERQTDFIFSVWSEEFGFAGSAGLIALYGLMFFFMVRMVTQCVRMEDRLILIGIFAIISFEVMVNLGVTLALAPVTGLTLPLISKGGTSLIMVYIGLGIVALVHRDRFRDV